MRFVVIPVLTVGFLCAGGCSQDSQWMPLSIGQSWTYRVRTPHYTYVEQVSVVRKAAVGDVMGFALQSELGESRMAWVKGKLAAESLGHTHFKPPIPLFNQNEEPAVVQWKGLIVLNGKSIKGVATLTCKPESIAYKGSKQVSKRADLLLTYDDQRIEWTSWFVAPDGIVRQEQRTNGELDLSLEMIRGT